MTIQSNLLTKIFPNQEKVEQTTQKSTQPETNALQLSKDQTEGSPEKTEGGRNKGGCKGCDGSKGCCGKTDKTGQQLAIRS